MKKNDYPKTGGVLCTLAGSYLFGDIFSKRAGNRFRSNFIEHQYYMSLW